jgi:hypothetical protein
VKHQAQGTNIQINHKPQIPKDFGAQVLALGIWRFSGAWMLESGASGA